MSYFPTPWATSPAAAILRRRLRSEPRSLLMLDYDGTLAPFHADRFKAAPYDGVEERLATLSTLSSTMQPRFRLVLVSGRSARELRDMLRPGIEVEIWGSHGREQLKRDGTYKLFTLDPLQQAALGQVGREMSGLGFSEALEVKPSSLAVHWRGYDAATQERIRSSVYSVFAGVGLTAGLHLLPFDGGVELRSADRTKGTVVGQILSEEPLALPIAYLGDDLTDEDAFAAVGSRGYPILVRTQVRESSARFWLRPPEELLEFLDDWIAAAQSPASTAVASAETAG